MKRPLLMHGKTRLLKSTDILNKESVAKMLGITERSASNLLQRWANEGTVYRTAPGCYMSAFVENDHDRLMLQSLRKAVGPNIIMVGASSWSRVGWCETPTLHVAIPLSPSRRVPRVRNTVLYPVGAKHWLQLSKESLQTDMEKPPILHPVSQMLWWMDKECPIEMPSPERVNWKAIQGEPLMRASICQHWPDQLQGQEKDLNVELLYRMLHMDRLTGTIPGRAEPIEVDEPAEDQNAGLSR